MFRAVLFVLSLLALSVAPSEARHSHRHVFQHQHRAHSPKALPRHHRFARPARAITIAALPDERIQTTSPPLQDAHHRHIDLRQTVLDPSGYSDTSRPRDCFGIQWCGCWLRHQFGLASTALNLARNWARMGSVADPGSANVVVWRHHVGRLLQYDGGRILVQSGNDRGAVRTRWLSPRALGGVIAYRRV